MTTEPAAPPKDTWRRILSHRLRELVWEMEWRPEEAIVAVRSLTWGAALLWPGDSFTASPQTYRAFMWTPEAELFWGVPAFLLGLFQLWAVLFSTRRLRARLSVATCLFWLLVATMYGFSNIHTLAPVSHGMTALVAAWVCMRLWMVEE